MNVLRTFCIVLFLACSSPAQSQAPNSCGDVLYDMPPQEFQNKIRIVKPVEGATVPAESEKKIASPQGTRWFIERAPDYKVKEPWNTTLYVGSRNDGKISLQANFTDHGTSFSAQWINEKLLFVQVWWGRFVSSDLILDVEQKRFIYNEAAFYGELSEGCKD